MDYFERREQDYTKWDQQIWLSVQKAIPLFQLKVAKCMLDLGSLTKLHVKDFKVNPCLENQLVLGEELYLDILRPGCVKAGYVTREIPTEEDLNAEDSDEESDDEQNGDGKKKSKKTKPYEVKKEKIVEQKRGKKGSKNNQAKNQNDIKMKIVKENLTQNLNDVMYSHSLERKQIDFNFLQNKLELKLITFFYIAYYIRKNKEKQNIQESQAFQLINIMLKVVRIFDGYVGRSFHSLKESKNKETGLMEVSSTLILDLKMCIKGMKKFYKYTHKKIIINYPKLVYYTSYDIYFPTLDITPYPSQIQFIQSAKKAFNVEGGNLATPTLVLYHTMIGSGKTSASISLSNLIHETKLLDQKNQNIQMLYCCLISSVRVQVGRYAYSKEQKFALAAMERSIKNQEYYYPRIINNNSCGNVQIVDLIISDLDCAYEMLRKNFTTPEEDEILALEQKERKKKKKIKLGQLEKENIVLFVDQPTAFCKNINSSATKNLFKILANFPPKLIIFASATMPTKDQIPNTIKLIQQRNPNLQVYQIDSKQFHVGCQYSSFKGEIIFPHTNIKTKEQLQKIINLIDSNAFLMRLYTGPSLYFLLKKCENEGIKDLPKIQQLPEIKQEDISNMTMKILKNLLKYSNDKIEQVCKLSVDESNLDCKIIESDVESDDIFGEDKKTEVKPQAKTDYVNFKNMLRQDAYKFLGGCLIATQNPLEFAKKYFSKWMKIGKKQYIKPIRRLLEKYKKDIEVFEKEIKILEDSDERDDNIMKKISKMEMEKQPKMEFPDHKRINTVEHYNKYCANKEPVHSSMLIKCIQIENVAEALIEKVDDFVLKLLFCGVALHVEKGLSPKYLEKVEELASQNLLAYIITDQSLCYGTNFPISNVIVCDDLARKLNMNEMFQLIGRAGRVGQSWTARAFLQEEGLQKLYNYIHSDSQKMSDEAEIFQTIAKKYLDNPELTLRTTKSEIRYVNYLKPDDRIQIIIKKKQKYDYHVIRKVTLVIFLQSQRVFSEKCLYKTINYYRFPQSDVLYEDLPTKLNSENVPIIDVSAYYKGEQQFIKKTLNKTVQRILSENLQGVIEEKTQINEFIGKSYNNFYCSQTNTFAVLIKCKQEFEINNFKFNVLEKTEPVPQIHEVMAHKLQAFIKECHRVAEKFHKNPNSVLANDVKKIKESHEEIMGRDDFLYYKQMFESCSKEIDEEYNRLSNEVHNAAIANELKVILMVEKYYDFNMVNDENFYIDASVRKNFKQIINYQPKP